MIWTTNLSFCLALLIVSQSSNAYRQKQTIIFKQPMASDAEFIAYVKTNDGYITPSDFLQQQFSEHLENNKIVESFKAAQSEYLSAQMVKAEQSFLKICSSSDKRHYAETIRKIIHYSCLRLAQLSKDLQWMSRAFYFDISQTADKKIFSPDLIASFESLVIKEQAIFKSFSLPPGIDYIFINGRGFSKYEFEAQRWPERSFYLTVLNYQGKFHSLSGSLASLNSLQRRKFKPCGSDHELDQWPTPHKIFGLGTCKPVPQPPAMAIDLRISPHAKENNFPAQISATKANRWWQNKWLWIGASVVTAGAVIYLHEANKQDNSSPEKNTPPAKRPGKKRGF